MKKQTNPPLCFTELTTQLEATKSELAEACRGAFRGVQDEDVFRTAGVPLVSAVSVNAMVSGSPKNAFDGPTMVRHCTEHPDNPEVKAVRDIALVFFCQFVDLTIRELKTVKAVKLLKSN